MAKNRQYDHEYKVQAVKLAQEIGQSKAATELGISKNTVYTWVREARRGNLDLGIGTHTPGSALSLNEELVQLRKVVKMQEKESGAYVKKMKFLEEACTFFRCEPSEVCKNERMSLLQ